MLLQTVFFTRKKKNCNFGIRCFLVQELSAEKSKMASLEVRLKKDLNVQVQEVSALRTRMQTADQEHLKHTQQLNQKVRFN